jgi:ankyrin repeat protein
MRFIKLFFLILVISIPSLSVGQQVMDVFEVARKGTISQAEAIVQTNPKAFSVINENGFSPLILACYRGNNEVAKFIITQGADINAKSDMGSALMACIVKGNNEIAQFLIANKADLNLVDSQGTTALMYAVQFKNIAIIKLLLTNNANKELKDNKGKTAFEYAVFSNDEAIINLLK